MAISRLLNVQRGALLVLLLPAGFSQTLNEDRGVMLSVATPAVDSQNTRSLPVQVRDPNGSKLDKLTVVTLYSFSGQSVSAQATSSSQAIFGQLGSGAYCVDVEALG
jgi:hypothetical protein